MAKQSENKPEKTTKKTEAKTEVKKPEVINTLKVEVTFPTIHDLKQALAFDNDGRLIIAIQFKAPVDQFEVFRLVNLLKQPHTGLSATITSPQSAMDFKFDPKAGKVDVIKAAVPAKLPQGKDIKETSPFEDKGGTLLDRTVFGHGNDGVVKVHGVSFNHIPEDDRPFGVVIEYVNGTGEIITVGGRGKTPTEAVISGVQNCGAVAKELSEPFEVKAALEGLEPSPDCYKLIRVLEVGSFDVEDKGAKPVKKGE